MPFVSANIEFSIADTVRAVDEVFARRRSRARDIVQDVRDDLEALGILMSQKSDEAMSLFVGFITPTVLNDPEQLRELTAATDRYLTRRVLLPRLQEAHGRIKGYVGNNALERQLDAGIRLRLQELDDHLDRYLAEIGADGAMTGTNHGDLYELNRLAKGFLYDTDGTKLAPIVEMAAHSLERMNFRLASDIHQMLGRVQGLLLDRTH